MLLLKPVTSTCLQGFQVLTARSEVLHFHAVNEACDMEVIFGDFQVLTALPQVFYFHALNEACDMKLSSRISKS